MMREIKFRAWDIDSKEFVYFNLNDSDKYELMFGRYGVLENTVLQDWQQYTGLRDKNGVEIYEGDILQLKNTKGQVSNHQEVYWDDESACWGWRTANEDSWPDSFSGFYDDYEVVGNIYENPDLLAQPNERKRDE